MDAVIREVVPLALGIAASPFPVIPAILLLFTARPRATAGAFLGGWVVGVAGAVTLAALVASVIEFYEGTPTWASWTRVALGAVLVLLGIRQWLVRSTASEPGWMRTLETATPGSAGRLGLVLSAANPKVLVLALAAGMAAGAAELTTAGLVGVLLVFTLVASVTVALPLLLYGVLGVRVLRPLGAARDWLRRHHAAVVAVVMVVLGVLLAAKGVSAF